MNPVSGLKPPWSNNSRSQSWRAVSSQDSQSLDCALRAAAGAGSTIRLTKAPL